MVNIRAVEVDVNVAEVNIIPTADVMVVVAAVDDGTKDVDVSTS